MKNTPTVATDNLNGIDLIKFLCSFLVVMIHVPFSIGGPFACIPSLSAWIKHTICRVAVPFYFTAAGFFLFRKMDLATPDRAVLTGYCGKLLRLFGLWSILLIVGGTGHLWYLSASIVAVILLGLLLRCKLSFPRLCILAVVLYGIGLFGDTYFGLIKPLRQYSIAHYLFSIYESFFKTTRNGVFMAPVFILIGVGFSRNKFRIKLPFACIGLLLSLAALVGEAYLLHSYDIPKDYNMYISLLPATFFLFSLALDMKLKPRPIYVKLRHIGTLIYFSHMLVAQTIIFGMNGLHQITGIKLSAHLLSLTLVTVVPLAVLVEALSRREKFRFLRFLYS
jgi:serine/alanine racemase